MNVIEAIHKGERYVYILIVISNRLILMISVMFFFNDTATTEIYTY